MTLPWISPKFHYFQSNNFAQIVINNQVQVYPCGWVFAYNFIVIDKFMGFN